MQITYYILRDVFKHNSDASISFQPGLSQGHTRAIQVLCLRSSIDSFITPTCPCMSTQPASRLHITCIQEAMHVTAVLPLAVEGHAFEDIDSMAVYIFDMGGGG